MEARSRARVRRVRAGTYLFFLALFAAILFLTHAPLLRLPYFWDEAGQYVPAALDILREGAWVPHSATPDVHPPGVLAYLAGAWRVAGFEPAVTRTAMLLLASFGLLASFLVAIELSKDVRGAPAFLAVALLCVSPLFFAQAMLAQLDAPAMTLMAVALLWFLQDRIPAAAAACVALVLVKETGLVAPMVFAGWLGYERRWREAAWFAAPALALGVWLAVLAARTGNFLGSGEFASYNLWYPLNPARVGAALGRRLYYLAFANFHWVGAAAIIYAWRRSRLFHGRSWKIAWLLAAAYTATVCVLGGAVLDRYLLPVVPIVYAAMVAGLSTLRRPLELVGGTVLLAGIAAANFINPPYPFPYENNLAMVDFVKLHQEAAAYLERWHGTARVATVWPLTAELERPELGFVERRLAVTTLPGLTREALAGFDWKRQQIVVIYSRAWNPRFSLLHFERLARFWHGVYGSVPDATRAEALASAPYRVEARFERRGQWVDIYVNPEPPPTSLEGLQRVQWLPAAGR